MNQCLTVFATTLLLLLIVPPTLAQSVQVDYDRSADFDSYRTFAWAETPQTSVRDESPLTHSRIKNAIEHYLAEGGLAENNEQPDVYVTYHTSSKEEVTYNTSSFGVGYGGGWGWDPYWGGGRNDGQHLRAWLADYRSVGCRHQEDDLPRFGERSGQVESRKARKADLQGDQENDRRVRQEVPEEPVSRKRASRPLFEIR
jgi:hypothetical protein